MKPGDLVIYRERFFTGTPTVGIIILVEDLKSDYTFYKVLLQSGKVMSIPDTKLTPV